MQRRALVPAAIAAVLTVAVIVVALLTLPDGARLGAGAGSLDPAAPGRIVAPVVRTSSGPVSGVRDDGVRAWRGLPYAAAPTGGLRWRPPQAPSSWREVRDASTYGASCLQPVPYDFGDTGLVSRPDSSEDCLFLNVVRPDDERRDLPVVVWLHGGGFFAGNGTTAAADGAALVERGIVLVTVNYRLGRLGFFAHPALRQDVANLGLLDQVAALEWVRDNAAAFGGDAANVTLAGGSAGAMSVNALMSSPVADGLFERAIAQSAPTDGQALSIAEARARGERAFPGLSVAELRDLPGDVLLSSRFNSLSGDAPIIDAVLPEPSVVAFAAGREQAVPYLVGTTSEEFSDADYRTFGVDPVQLRSALGGDRHDALVAAYGRPAFARDVLDDLVFGLAAVERARDHARRAPTYRYEFDAAPQSGHGAEGPYVFDTIEGGAPGRVADAVADYWVAFARSGSPQVGGLPTWPGATRAEGSAYVEITRGGPVPHPTDARVARLAALRAALS